MVIQFSSSSPDDSHCYSAHAGVAAAAFLPDPLLMGYDLISACVSSARSLPVKSHQPFTINDPSVDMSLSELDII